MNVDTAYIALVFVSSVVTVTVGRHEGGFYVEDDGPGVAPDERDGEFEYEFTTADDGTGLGLAIVDAIARSRLVGRDNGRERRRRPRRRRGRRPHRDPGVR